MSFEPCDPPRHAWDFTDSGLVACTCGETTARLTRTEQGWEIRLADGTPLLSMSGSGKRVGTNVSLQTLVTVTPCE